MKDIAPTSHTGEYVPALASAANARRVLGANSNRTPRRVAKGIPLSAFLIAGEAPGFRPGIRPLKNSTLEFYIWKRRFHSIASQKQQNSGRLLQESVCFFVNGTQRARNTVFCVGQIVVRSFVSIDIVGSSFTFNIFFASRFSPRLFPSPLDPGLLPVPQPAAMLS